MGHVAPRATLAPPSPEAKRNLKCSTEDRSLVECLRTDAKGRVIDAEDRQLSHEHAYAARDRDDDDDRPRRRRYRDSDDDDRPSRRSYERSERSYSRDSWQGGGWGSWGGGGGWGGGWGRGNRW